MNRHLICVCIQKESWDTLDCNYRRPSWLPSWKICNKCYWFLHIYTLRPSYRMNRRFICLCIQKRAEIHMIVIFGGHLGLAAILENMQLMLLIFTYLYSATSTLYEWTLYLSLYLKGELRYIRFGISVAMLAAILDFFFHIFPNSWPYMWYSCNIWLKYSQ